MLVWQPRYTFKLLFDLFPTGRTKSVWIDRFTIDGIKVFFDKQTVDLASMPICRQKRHEQPFSELCYW